MLSPQATWLTVRVVCGHYKKLGQLHEVVKCPRLHEHIEEACKSLDALYSYLVNTFGSTITKEYVIQARARALEIVATCQREKIQVLLPIEGEYPKALLAIDQPPAILFVKGSAALLSKPSVAVVGTRKPSGRGKQFAYNAAAKLARGGYVVISGLALGCDTQGHRGALVEPGRTVAVLAHGLDQIYPPGNAGLATAILKKGGCLVSEYFPGVRAAKYQFVARNRIQSGLSTKGVVVIESAQQGGTMHTARACVSQKKPLACMGLPVGSNTLLDSMSGNLKMIRTMSAFTLNSLDDIDAFLAMEPPRNQQQSIADFFPTNGKRKVVVSDEQRMRMLTSRLRALQTRLSKIPVQSSEEIDAHQQEQSAKLQASIMAVRKEIDLVECKPSASSAPSAGGIEKKSRM